MRDRTYLCLVEKESSASRHKGAQHEGVCVVQVWRYMLCVGGIRGGGRGV